MYRVINHEEYVKLEESLGSRVQYTSTYYCLSLANVEGIVVRENAEVLTVISALAIEKALNNYVLEEKIKDVATSQIRKQVKKGFWT